MKLFELALCTYARYRTRHLLHLARPDAELGPIASGVQDTRHALTITREVNSPAVARKTWIVGWTRHGLALEPYPYCIAGNVAPEGEEQWN